MKCFSFHLGAWEFFIAGYRMTFLDLFGQIYWLFFWIKPFYRIIHLWLVLPVVWLLELPVLQCSTMGILRIYRKIFCVRPMTQWVQQPYPKRLQEILFSENTPDWYLQSLPFVLSKHPELWCWGWWRVHPDSSFYHLVLGLLSADLSHFFEAPWNFMPTSPEPTSPGRSQLLGLFFLFELIFLLDRGPDVEMGLILLRIVFLLMLR